MDATSTRPYAMPALLTAGLVSGSHLRAIWEQVSSHDGFIHWACGRADVCGGSVDPVVELDFGDPKQTLGGFEA